METPNLTDNVPTHCFERTDRVRLCLHCKRRFVLAQSTLYNRFKTRVQQKNDFNANFLHSELSLAGGCSIRS